MKKTLSLLLSCVILLLAGCGNQAPDGQLRAEDLPESCRAWFDIGQTAGAAEEKTDLPVAAQADRGITDTGLSVRLPDLTEADLVDEDDTITQGVKLSALTDGKMQRLSSGSRVKWNGEAYHAFTFAAQDCTIPNLRPNDGGILRLDISGDCTVDGGGADYACFEGFDSVLITGTGTLTVTNASGLGCTGTDLGLPALMIDGSVTLRSESIHLSAGASAAPALVLLGDASVYAQSLWLDGSALVQAGGILGAYDIFNLGEATFRGGTALLGNMNDSDGAHLVLSGGDAYIQGALPANTAIESGAGTLCAPGLENAQVNHSGAQVRDSEKDGTPLCYTDHSPDWAASIPNAQWDALTSRQVVPSREGAEKWFLGQMTLEGTTAENVQPWGALHLRLRGENTVTGEIAGTSLLFTGGGAIGADSVNIWGWGGVHEPTLSVQEDCTVRCGQLHMGSEAAGQGTLLVESGSLTVDGEFWLQNAILEVRGGTVTLSGESSIEQGELRISGGTVVLENGLWLGQGDVVLSGGKLVLPQGEESLVLESGKLHNHGGDIVTE